MESCPVVTHSHAPIPHFLLSIQESVHNEKLAHAFAEAQKYTAHAQSLSSAYIHSQTSQKRRGKKVCSWTDRSKKYMPWLAVSAHRFCEPIIFETKLTMALAGWSGSSSAKRWLTLSVVLPCLRATNPNNLEGRIIVMISVYTCKWAVVLSHCFHSRVLTWPDLPQVCSICKFQMRKCVNKFTDSVMSWNVY